MMNDQNQIKGFVGVYADERGRVVATVTDFCPSHPGGFTAREAQEVRCRRNLAGEVIRAYCADPIYRAMTEHEYESILNRLPGTKTYIPVGYED